MNIKKQMLILIPNGGISMKKLFSFVLLFCFISIMFSEELNINPKLKDAIESYFITAIPMYYQGETFEKIRNSVSTNNFHMLGSDKDLFTLMRGTDSLIFDFYYLIEHKRQDVQAILLSRQLEEKKYYEYWIFKISDAGKPYNYAYFFLTETDNLVNERTIISESKIYMNEYKITDNIILNLEIKELIVLYQSKPWLKLESFKNTIYENKIVKWKGDVPYLRNMNLFEKLYYKSLKKSDK